MTSNSTLPAPSKSPLDRLEQSLCANERQSVLLATIDEKLLYALDSMKGEARDDELRNCWMLLWTAREIHDRLHSEMGEAHGEMYRLRLAERTAA